MKSICFVIPARMDSERFPNKLNAIYAEKPIIEHIVEKVAILKLAFHRDFNVQVVITIDEAEFVHYRNVYEICKKHGFTYLSLKGKESSCGSEKVKWAKSMLKKKYDYYITIPADEPSINPENLYYSIKAIIDKREKNTLYTLFTDFFNSADLVDNRSCKIVTDYNDNIMYTSRAIIPAKKDGFLHPLSVYKKHLGVFIFPKQIIKDDVWVQINNSALESLEQNMYINRKFKFKVFKIAHNGFGIDTEDQIEKLEKRMGLFKDK